MLVKHEDGRYLTFEEQEIQIEQAIMEQKSERFMKELMADLRAKATVVHL